MKAVKASHSTKQLPKEKRYPVAQYMDKDPR